jgi:ATP-dependent DNA helicase RecQ
LKSQRSVEIASMPAQQQRVSSNSASSRLLELDPASMGLFIHLRDLRKQLADDQSMPPYIIFPDSSLRAMAQQRPQSEAHFASIPGVGSRKLEAFFISFTTAIREYCEAHSLLMELEPPDKAEEQKREATSRISAGPSTRQATLDLYNEGRSLEEIARERNLKPSTVISHLAELIEAGETIDVEILMHPGHYDDIVDALQQVGGDALKPVKELLGDDYSYEEIRLVRALFRSRTRQTVERLESS